jgi:iron complex transport system ATP-binding protein
MNAIEIADLRCGYEDEPVIRGVSLEVRTGEFLGVLGPNGAGKTTLLRAMTGLLMPQSGCVLLHGRDVRSQGPRQVAQQVACVMQDQTAAVGAGHLAYSVRDIVSMGRTPYLSRTGWETANDRVAVEKAMRQAEITGLAERPITELSGGERQRAFIAMALAQECEILLLDEPTNHLDIAHQAGILNLFASLNRHDGKTLVGVFHDLNLAAEYCGWLVLLKAGRVAEAGPPEAVLSGPTIQRVYGAEVTVGRSPVSGRPHTFLGRDRPGV